MVGDGWCFLPQSKCIIRLCHIFLLCKTDLCLRCSVSGRDVLFLSQSFSNPLNVFLSLSESALSKVQSTPTRASRRNQSKVKSRPPEPEVDLQLLKTLCKENDCNTEEVWAHHSTLQSLYKHISFTSGSTNCGLFIGCLIVFAGKKCLPDQFHRFFGLTGSYKSSRFSSGMDATAPLLFGRGIMLSIYCFDWLPV